MRSPTNNPRKGPIRSGGSLDGVHYEVPLQLNRKQRRIVEKGRKRGVIAPPAPEDVIK